MYPNDFVFFTLLGILWELIEFTLSKTLRDGGQSVMRDKNNELEYNSNWWAGSSKDIVFNTIGLMVGIYLKNMMNHV